MKTNVLKIIVIAVFIFTVIPSFSQTKSIITIKSMTIENGDTVVNEKTYTGDGNLMIDDTLFNNQFHIGSMNSDMDLDSIFNFSQHFRNLDLSQFFDNQDWPEMFNNLNGNSHDMFQFNPNIMDNMIKKFSDSLQQDENMNRFFNPKSFEDNNFGRNTNQSVVCTPVPTAKKEISNIEVIIEPNSPYLRVAFDLSKNSGSSIYIYDDQNKQISEETVRKGSGTYSRLYDSSNFPDDCCYLVVKQGKKLSKYRILQIRK